MVQRVQQHGPRPDRLLYSPARRTRQTAAPLIEAFRLADDQAQPCDEIYDATFGMLLTLLQRQPDSAHHLLLVGHNPGLEVLARWLCPAAPEHLPTAACVQLGLKLAHWADLVPECAELLWLDYPKLHPPVDHRAR
jgi:phosphohistidine phosphatase